LDELEQTIRDNAAGPKKVSGDSISVEQHSIKDQIELEKHLTGKSAASRGMRGVLLQRAIPPGAV